MGSKGKILKISWKPKKTNQTVVALGGTERSLTKTFRSWQHEVFLARIQK